MLPPQPSDAEVWAAFRQGDEQAYAALYEQHAAALYEYGVRLVQDEFLVRDVLHDLFVKLWTKRAKLGSIDNVRYYLLTGLRNALLDKKRHDQRYQHLSLDDEAPFKLSFSPEAEVLQQQEQQEQSARLLVAMEQLSPRQKQVIYLRYYEELEYAQIAELLAINIKGVYKLTARALDALKEIMNVPRPLLLALLLGWRCGG
jgi:RNA polymerase sigma factor (sigma-70 family)